MDEAKKTTLEEDVILPEEEHTAPEQENADADDALESFLSREQEQDNKPQRNKRAPRGLIILIAAAVAVAGLAAAVILINRSPYPESTDDSYTPAEIVATVDEAGVHTAQVPTEADGTPVQNGEGTLLAYTPGELLEIRVEHADGQKFALETGTDADGSAVYNLIGYDSYPLQTGAPDAVANDAANLSFSTVVSVGGDPADFGLDQPRAVVRVKYTDGTLSTIYVGAEAPASAGSYLAFGDTDTVYLVADDAVDSFLYTVHDLISRVITEAAESVDTADPISLTISGDRYPEPIVIEANDDAAVNYSYQMTAPHTAFAAMTESADVTGSVRDLYAEEIAGVCKPDDDLDSFLAGYGLSGSYAEITAKYPDTTIRLRCSAPDSEGNVCLVRGGEQYPGERIVYRIQLASIRWANTSYEALVSDTVLDVNKESLSGIKITADGKSYDITVDTRTQSVEDTEGNTEEVTTTEAYYKNKALDTDGFSILCQNLAATPNTHDDLKAGDTVLYEIQYRYSTGRAADVIQVYDNGTKTCPVALNGTLIGATKKAYVTTLIENIKDVTSGKLPESL